MSEIHCRWMGREQPRAVVNRHEDRCADDECRGCLPCPSGHCRVCETIHAEGTCPDCLDETRETIAEIVRLCADLDLEVEAKGVESEAMHLLGPTAQPEAWRQRGRFGHRYDLEARLGENHPLWVLGTWEMLYRDAFDHTSHDRVSVTDAAGYLDRNLGYMSGYSDVPFEDLARDARSCRAHLEAVLHDGEQRDQGAPCMNCGALLERTWDHTGSGNDGWKCPRCKRTSTEAQYRFAVAHLHREEATELTDRDMEIRTGVKAGTIRVWANRDLVRKRRDSGRVLYSVRDVLDQAQASGLVS